MIGQTTLVAAVEQSADCIVVFDATGKIQYVNPAFTTMTGYSGEEILGQNMTTLRSGLQSEEFYEQRWNTIRSGRSWQGSMMNRRKDGSYYPEEMRITPVRDPSGEISGFIAVKQDVTKRHQAEQEILDSREFAQSTIDALSSHICVLDEAGTIIAVNKAWREFSRENQSLHQVEAESQDEDRDGIGRNYLDVCERVCGEEVREATDFASGIRAVLRGESEQFSAEYSCHSPCKQRWFLSKVTRFVSNSQPRIVVEHVNITERRLAEDSLKAATHAAELEATRCRFRNSLIRAIHEVSPNGILAVDANGRIVSHNQRALDIWKISPEIGETLTSTVDGVPDHVVLAPSLSLLENQDTFLARVRDLYDHPEETDHCELEFKDGRTIERYSNSIWDEKRQYLGRVWFFRDITYRKQAQQALVDSEEKFRQLAENSSQVFWILDLIENKVLYVSPAYENVWGRSCESLYQDQMSWMSAIHPDDRPGVLSQFVDVKQEHAIESEYRIQTPDGREKWIHDHAFPVRDCSGRVIRIVGIAEETTERKLAQASLQSSNDRLALATRGAAIGVWDYDVENNCLVWDDQMLRLYDLSEEQFCGAYEAWAAVLHPEDRARANDEVRQAIAGERDFDTSFRIVWKDGSVRLIRAVALVKRDSSGKALNVIGTNWDITAQNRAADELRESNRLLEEAMLGCSRLAMEAASANVAKSRFLANMSHEIRTPMNGVIGMLQLLQETDLTSEQRQFVKIAQTSGRILLTLINDVLDLSKIEAGKVVLESLSFNIDRTIAEVIQILDIQAISKGLTVTSQVSPQIPQLLGGDSHRLRQVLTNLTANAIKFTDQGEVALNAEQIADAEGKVTVRFTVTDTGIGIRPEQAAVLFTPFTQGDGSTTRKYGGTGLGLAICRQLVEMMGGEIGVDSQEGEGSVFWFTAVFAKVNEQPSASMVGQRGLKIAGSGMKDTGPKQSRAVKDVHSARILIAEDNKINQVVALAQVRKLGYEADVVSNGAEAVEAVQRGKYALVLMDCEMPVMDGLQATHRIRELNYAGLPIVALTASAMAGDRNRCIRAGMNDFLSKPADLERLSAVLAQWCPDCHPSGVAQTFVKPAPELPDLCTFDSEALLQRLMGDRQLAELVLKGFIDDAPTQLSKLRNLVDAADSAGIRMQAHTLKGSAGTVAATNLSTIARDMEHAAAVSDFGQCEALLSDAIKEFEGLKATLGHAGWLESQENCTI